MGLGQNRAPRIGEADEIISIGTPAMQEDHQLPGVAGFRGRTFGAGDGRKFVHSEFPMGVIFLLYLRANPEFRSYST